MEKEEQVTFISVNGGTPVRASMKVRHRQEDEWPTLSTIEPPHERTRERELAERVGLVWDE